MLFFLITFCIFHICLLCACFIHIFLYGDICFTWLSCFFLIFVLSFLTFYMFGYIFLVPWHIFYIATLFSYHFYNESVLFCKTIHRLAFPLPPSTPPARPVFYISGFPGHTFSTSNSLHRFLCRFLFIFTSFFDHLLKVILYFFHPFFEAYF